MSKTRATLTGGGAFALGYQTGCLVYHTEKGIEFDRLDGVSGGALAAFLFSVFGTDAPEVLKKIVNNSQIYGSQGAFNFVKNLATSSINGYYDYTALEKFLRDECHERTLKIELGVGLYDLTEGDTITMVFEKGVAAQDVIGNIIEALTIPAFVQIKGRYCDAGMKDCFVYKPLLTELKDYSNIYVFSVYNPEVKNIITEHSKFKDYSRLAIDVMLTESFTHNYNILKKACMASRVRLWVCKAEDKFDVFKFDTENIMGSYKHAMSQFLLAEKLAEEEIAERFLNVNVGE